jgi:hypothetical protein
MKRAIGGYCAKYIADQHEEAGKRRGQSAGEACMDYHNNHIAREVEEKGYDQEWACEAGAIRGAGRLRLPCAQLCDVALKRGHLKTAPCHEGGSN